jgi:two-component system phosphate regulon sensor histidine kinase PhoR
MRFRAIQRSITLSAIVLACAGMVPLVVALVCAKHTYDVIIPLVASAMVVISIGGWLLFYRVDTCLRSIERVSKAMAAGDLSARVETTRKPILMTLVRSINQLAASLERRVEGLARARSEQDAILRTMVEGVVTVDSNGNIRLVNSAARELLDTAQDHLEGSSIDDIVQHPDLRRCITDAMRTDTITSVTAHVGGASGKMLVVHASPLVEEHGAAPGTLLVIHDVTRLERLENVRRDFVANVSHELRTPITSIKGFVETLLDGAVDDPVLSKKFLAIVGRQAERLNLILTDLLTLAKLEVGGEGRVETEDKNLRDLVQVAIDECSHRAQAKEMFLRSQFHSELSVRANSSLVEQALVNLIDNAIKYTETKGEVRVEVHKAGDFAEIRVTDTGPGIDGQHLSRLFERFYRIDQGRSRQLGGTGLGLAIVKHIAQVHGGRVIVESVVGQGTTFSLFLPLVVN